VHSNLENRQDGRKGTPRRRQQKNSSFGEGLNFNNLFSTQLLHNHETDSHNPSQASLPGVAQRYRPSQVRRAESTQFALQHLHAQETEEHDEKQRGPWREKQ
jgi:hypothetical protein